MEPKGDIALIGLAVMGRNLILNMNDHGFTVVAHNRTLSRVDDFMTGEAEGTNVIGAQSIPEMVANLKHPRRVMMLVKAGQPVDEFIEKLLPHLAPGDIIIDGGNSHFPDTNRRTKYLASKGIRFVGTGVSGAAKAGYLIGASFSDGAKSGSISLFRVSGTGHLYKEAMGLWADFESKHARWLVDTWALINIPYDADTRLPRLQRHRRVPPRRCCRIH